MLSCCLLMGWGYVPVLLVVHHSIGAFGCWMGPHLDVKMVASRTTLCQRIPSSSPTSVPVLTVSHICPPYLPRRPSKTCRLLWSCCFALGPTECETLFSSSETGVSVSPSPVKFLQLSPGGLQSQMLCGLLLRWSDPHTGEPAMRLRTLIPVEKLLQCNYFPVCGCPPRIFGI